MIILWLNGYDELIFLKDFFLLYHLTFLIVVFSFYVHNSMFKSHLELFQQFKRNKTNLSEVQLLNHREHSPILTGVWAPSR